MTNKAIIQFLVDSIENRLENTDLPESELSDASRYEDLGLDSINLVELALLIEKDMNVVLTDEQLFDLATIGKTATYIEAMSPRTSGLEQSTS